MTPAGKPRAARGQARARWQAHAPAAGALRSWLVDQSSLTLKLRARCQQFRVRRLHQSRAPCLADEAGAIGLVRVHQVWEREVLLECDQVPMVFAHTVVPLAATANDWPLFSALGERSLGSTLFGDPQVQQGCLHWARLRPVHPLAQRARAALATRLGPAHALLAQLQGQPLFARRCLYRRKRGVLLVTEVFFPWVLQLAAPAYASAIGTVQK